MRSFKNKRLVVALTNERGRVLEKPVRCLRCKKKVTFINPTAVHCKQCGTLDIKELVDCLPIKYTPQLVFTESN